MAFGWLGYEQESSLMNDMVSFSSFTSSSFWMGVWLANNQIANGVLGGVWSFKRCACVLVWV
jgi:hypothetical protein